MPNDSIRVLPFAIRYHQAGWAVIPIPYGQKKPVLEGWQALKLDGPRVVATFAGQPKNIGVLLGEPSGWLIDIDLDHQRAVELADQFLPPTPAVFGRPGKPRSHRIFRATAPVATHKRRQAALGMIVELRSSGAQTVIPPSVHPSGEVVTWCGDDIAPAIVDPETLLRAVDALADAVCQAEKVDPKDTRQPKPARRRKSPRKGISVIERARRYLAAMPPAVSGQGGHDQTFDAACSLVLGFGLSIPEAAPLLAEYNQRCQPPWSDAELAHKLDDADKCPGDRGYLLEAGGDNRFGDRGCVLESGDADGTNVLEADDDPHRLARVNLRRYSELTGGRTIKYWRSEWYVWKGNRYRKIQEDEFRAKMSFAIKEEFNRLNLEAQERFRSGQDAGLIAPDEEPPKARKVTPSLVSSVLQATASLVAVSGDIEVGTWLPTRQRKNWLSFQNGILDIDALLADREADECFRPNSPEWFSTVSIPYDFNPQATCPFFENVLDHNLDMDPEKVKILQEWAGYLLTPDTGEQKFLILEGEGSNGKSVYVAAVTAMLGEENVSTVPLEVFGERFARAETLGKLLNAAADCGELDKVAEGYLKPFTSGDRMFFDRKGVPGLNCRPTARLMVAVNTRPRFSDRSRGIWRRMKLIKFDVEITKEVRIKGLDKVEYWQASDDLPGILNWALRGLARLRAQNGFTESESENQEIEDYKEEVNPARAFLNEYVEESRSGKISSRLLYGWYKKWGTENGYHPLSERMFGKEVKRKFPRMEKRRMGPRNARQFEYFGIQFSQEEIGGEKIGETRLF